jgi:DNA repair protein RadD
MQVLIRRSGNMIQVVPSMASLLVPALQYTKRIQKGGGRECEYQERQLSEIYEDSLIAPAGLTSRVAAVLRAEGYQIQYQDLRQHRLPLPDLSRLEPLREGQEPVLAAIISSDCGIIEAPTGAGKSFMIRQLCRIWPTARIVVCSYSKDIVRMLYTELLELLPPEEVGLVGDGSCQNDRRVVCVVDKSLMKLDLEDIDIFIYDEVHRAAAEMTKNTIYKCRNARMWGFSASPKGRADGADMETEAMFGPQIATLTYEEVQKTGSIVPMIVFRVSCSHLRPIVANTQTAVERHGLWRNEDRNELIAQMVGWVDQYFPPDQQILIAVKSVEHAVHLGSYLPDFKLVYATMDPDRRESWERWGLIKKGDHPLTAHAREQARLDFRDGKLRRAIATGVWSTGVDFPGLNVVIRADGQRSTIQATQVPGRATRSNDGKKEYGIVIDFDDKFHDTLANRALGRFRHYRKKGWTIEEVAPKDPREV